MRCSRRSSGELAACAANLGGEVAHLKVIGMDDAGAFAVGNVVSNDTDAKLSLPSNLTPKEADLIVNARVAIDPAVLEAEVKKVVAAECAKVGVTAEFRTRRASARPPRADAPLRRSKVASNCTRMMRMKAGLKTIRGTECFFDPLDP